MARAMGVRSWYGANRAGGKLGRYLSMGRKSMGGASFPPGGASIMQTANRAKGKVIDRCRAIPQSVMCGSTERLNSGSGHPSAWMKPWPGWNPISRSRIKGVCTPSTLGKPGDAWSKAATVSSGGQICRHGESRPTLIISLVPSCRPRSAPLLGSDLYQQM